MKANVGDRAPYIQEPPESRFQRLVHFPPYTQVMGGKGSKPMVSEQRALGHHLEPPTHYTSENSET